MITSILCPIDGSEHSDKAVTLAADLAQLYDAKLCLLHVYMGNLSVKELERFAERADFQEIVEAEISRLNSHVTAMVGAYPAVGYLPPPSETVVSALADVLMADANRLASASTTRECKSLMASGDPAQAILKQVEAQDIDLIVMGSRGLGGIKGVLQGSVSQKVNHLSPCTCVTVK